MDTTSNRHLALDTAANRLKMAKMMALLTLALAVTYVFTPLPMQMALVIVGMVTAVYALFNFLIFRYRMRMLNKSV